MWAIVSKRCLDGKRQRGVEGSEEWGKEAAKHEEPLAIGSKTCSGCRLLSARGERMVKDSKRGAARGGRRQQGMTSCGLLAERGVQGVGYWQQEVFSVRFIVSKRCSGGKRQQERYAARRGEEGHGLLLAKGDQGAGY